MNIFKNMECGKQTKQAQSTMKRQKTFIIPIITIASICAFAATICVVAVGGGDGSLYENFYSNRFEISSSSSQNIKSRNKRNSVATTTSQKRHNHHHQRSFINESTIFKGSHFMNLSQHLNNYNINTNNNNNTRPSTLINIDTPLKADQYPYKQPRLPSDLIPSHYILDLDIDIKKENFTGTVTILLDCEGPTDQVIFHGRNLHLLNIQMEDGNSKPVNYKSIAFLKEHDMYVVMLNQTLEEDSDLRLFIQYTARFNKVLGGLYKSIYTDFGVQK